jgi:drug/metabolite transporter (DMT)-like permease
MKYKHNLPLGITFSLLCAFFYSSQTAIVKQTVAILPPIPVVIFLQTVISFILFLPFLFKNGWHQATKTMHSRKLNFQFYRSICSLTLMYSLFYSVKFIPLVNAMLLINTAPLMIPFVGYLFFSQRIDHRVWLPIFIGFIGVIIVLNPNTKIIHWASLLALGGGVCMAIGLQLIRRASMVDSADTTTFYFLLFATLLSAGVTIYFWVPLTSVMWKPLLVIGILYFLVQYTTSYALKFANSQLVATLFYSNIIFAAILSNVLWQTIPSLGTDMGIILIVTGGILCIRVEKRNLQQALAVNQLPEMAKTE